MGCCRWLPVRTVVFGIIFVIGGCHRNIGIQNTVAPCRALHMFVIFILVATHAFLSFFLKVSQGRLWESPWLLFPHGLPIVLGDASVATGDLRWSHGAVLGPLFATGSWNFHFPMLKKNMGESGRFNYFDLSPFPYIYLKKKISTSTSSTNNNNHNNNNQQQPKQQQKTK